MRYGSICFGFVNNLIKIIFGHNTLHKILLEEVKSPLNIPIVNKQKFQYYILLIK